MPNERIKNAGTKLGLIPYIMAGENSMSQTLEQMHLLAKHCKVIEVGIAFSSPIADGIIIQNASMKSLQNNTKISEIFNCIEQFRTTNKQTAIILMGYYNIFHKYGINAFAKKCNQIGVDGVIICDISIEESGEINKTFQQNQVNLIQLITSLTDENRIKLITSQANGFIYFVSIMGVTGSKEAELNVLQEQYSKIKQQTTLPIVVGFGVKKPEIAKKLYKIFDGVVVGSYFINHYNQISLNSNNALQNFEEEVIKFTEQNI